MNRFSKSLLLGAALALGSLTLTPAALAVDEQYLVQGLGASGYDVVAYFTEGKPVQGSPEFTATHDGATWQFSSAAHRDAFVAEPARYVPQYGGFCAFGASVGRKFPGDPNAWKVVDGKLYLNLNQDVQAKWVQDIPGYVRGADHNWPLISSIADKQLESAPPVGLTQGAIP